MLGGNPGSQAEMSGSGVDAELGGTTGAYLVLLDEDDSASGLSALQAAGMPKPTRVKGSGRRAVDSKKLAAEGSVVFEELGVAVMSVGAEQHQAVLAAAAESPAVLRIEPERRVWAIERITVSEDYLRGYRDAVDHLVGGVLREDGGLTVRIASSEESVTTWGLQACRVVESCFTGRGVRVAVLDTGVDLTHPDLVGRVLTTESFIDGEGIQDGHGHGTHVIGTSCGTATPATLPRYGVASEAEIFAGKVLSNAGSGADRGILAGINWAVANGCRVVSMSLGAPVGLGATFSPIFERAAQRALRRGTLIVAAAGNESNRPENIQPVGHPANCPSILAVAALDDALAVAKFSCAGLNPDGGQIDIAAPGVDVYSAWPMPLGNKRLNGTSMATPHVAGIVALLAEAHPDATAAELKSLLLGSARRLELASTDVGAGLVQAP